MKVKGKEIPVKIYAALEGTTREEQREVIEGNVTVGIHGTTSKVTIRDTSKNGLALTHMQGAVNKGDLTQLTLHLPTLVQPLQLQGRVVWKEQGKVGFLFIDPQPGDQQAQIELTPQWGAREE